MTLALVPALALSACGEPLDTTRRTPERGTLGEEIFRLFHRDFEAEDPRRARGFEAAREDFVAAVDHVFPPEELAYAQDFLVKLLPLYDDGTFPQSTRLIAGLLERLSADGDALRGLAVIGNRAGYVERTREEALIRRIKDHPKYRDLAKAILRLQLDHDGLDGQGNEDPNESNAMARLMKPLSKRLAELEISEDDERTLVLAANLLLREDERFRDPGAVQAEIVARDARGMAQVRALEAPFVDRDQDRLPDIDEEGRFVSEAGPMEVAPFGTEGPRDERSRAVDARGQPIFEYIDVGQTLTASLLRDARRLSAADVPMRAVRTLETVLGERTPEGTFSAENNALLDLAHAMGQGLDVDELPEVIGLARELVDGHEGATAWALLELEAQLDIADGYDVNLRPNAKFFNDLMGVFRKVVEVPGLLESLLEAFEDPRVAKLPTVMAQLMRHKKEYVSDGDYFEETIFGEQVDRAQLDTPENQSLMQRLLHLMHDTRGKSYAPSNVQRILNLVPFGFGQLNDIRNFRIDDLAEFYLLAIIGEAEVPRGVSNAVNLMTRVPVIGIDYGLSQQPQPSELALFLNQDVGLLGNPVGNEGFAVRDNDGDTLFAASESPEAAPPWTREGARENRLTVALYPIVRAFHAHGQMNLLMDLFEVLYQHWPTVEGGSYQDRSPQEARYAQLSGLARFEPMLIDGFEKTKLLQAGQKLLREANSVALPGGRPAREVLAILVRKILTIDLDLRTREGRREVLVDGARITPLSPLDLARGALDELDRLVHRSPSTLEDWNALLDELHAVYLGTERTGPESARFANRRALPTAATLLEFLEERATKHKAALGLSRWITRDVVAQVEDLLTAPELPALLDVIHAIDEDETLKANLGELRDDLLDDARGLGDLLVTLGTGLSAAKDARYAVSVLRFVGRELDPDTKLLSTLAALTDKAVALDQDEHMLELLRRALDAPPRGGLYAYGLTDAIRQANRVDPLSTKNASSEDLAKISAAAARYMRDDQHGLEKFYEMVKNRTVEGRAR